MNPSRLILRHRRSCFVWRGSIPLAIAVLLSMTAPGAAGPPEDPIVTALEQALLAYRGGNVGNAQAWTAVAGSLLDEKTAVSSGDKWVQGNTAQLLPLLDLYSQVAGGRDANLDRDVEKLVGLLRQVDMLNRGPVRPAECAGMSVDYDPFSFLARRLGDVVIDYSPFTRQIRKLGEFNIDYSPFTGQPRQIGPVVIDWDPFRATVRSIGGVALY